MSKVGYKNFVRFIRAKGKMDGGDVCATCGTRNWHVQLPDDDDGPGSEQTLGVGYYSRSQDGKNQLSPLVTGAMPVVAIICSNCGMTRLYATSVVADWVKENPEDEQ